MSQRSQQMYSQMYGRIVQKLTDNLGFQASTAEDLANLIVERIGQYTLGNMRRLQQQGEYVTSGYRSLRDFIDAIDNSSFGITKEDVQRLVKLVNQGNAIRELNAFLESKGALVRTTMEQELELFPEVPNSPTEIRKLLEGNIQQRIVDKTKFTIQDIRDKLQVMTFQGMLKNILFTAFGVLLSLGVDNELVIGMIPMGGFGINSPCSVQSIEVAHSNKIVKFRAVGSIFLAHQLGGRDSIQVKGKLTGELRTFFLGFLWLLTLASAGYVKDFDLSDNPAVTQLNLASDPEGFRNNKIPPTSLAQIDGITVEKPSYIKHITFPVVTSHEIVTNCYIETLSFEEKIDSGRDVITYDLLMRTYEEPEEFMADLAKGLYKANSRTKSEHVIRFFINAVWRLAKYAKESFNLETNHWKYDNYYNVDAADMGTAFAMALAGAV